MHHRSPQRHSYRGLQGKDGTASMAWGLSRKRGASPMLPWDKGSLVPNGLQRRGHTSVLYPQA